MDPRSPTLSCKDAATIVAGIVGTPGEFERGASNEGSSKGSYEAFGGDKAASSKSAICSLDWIIAMRLLISGRAGDRPIVVVSGVIRCIQLAASTSRVTS